jgi:hypothetical protein
VWRGDPVRVVGVPVIVREVRVCQRLLAFAVGVLAQLPQPLARPQVYHLRPLKLDYSSS